MEKSIEQRIGYCYSLQMSDVENFSNI
jgi:hypothetical protein